MDTVFHVSTLPRLMCIRVPVERGVSEPSYGANRYITYMQLTGT